MLVKIGTAKKEENAYDIWKENIRKKQNMDISFLLDYVNLVTLGICLCVGFALKYAKLFEWLGNQYIPVSMLVLGTVINLAINWPDMNSHVILGGMISGLASTGLYEMMRNMLSKNKKNDSDSSGD